MAQAPQYMANPDGLSLSTKLEIFISCRNIPKMDIGSPSDPFIVIYEKDKIAKNFRLLNTTEIIWDNHSPNFTKTIELDYKFEEVQHLRMDIYDANTDDVNDLRKHDYIGHAEFILGDLVTAASQRLVMKVKNKQNKAVMVNKVPSVIRVHCKEKATTKDEIILNLAAKDLPKMDWFGKADPFVEIFRGETDANGELMLSAVHRTEYIKSTYKPDWKQFMIQKARLCGNDITCPLVFKVFDWNRDAEPDYIGEVQTTLEEIQGVNQLQLIDARNKKKKKKRGILLIRKVEIKEKYGFLEYIMGGMEINLVVAIDFTGSNGDPRDRNSLHYMGPPNNESQYLKVIRSVGRVLESYDSDNMITTFGFGANLAPPQKMISHCFPLTFNENNPDVRGIQGVIGAYTNALTRVQLYGPTYFHELIRTVHASIASVNMADTQLYTILLIITDGVINDMRATIDAIVDATLAPLSIVIVGVGGADFSNMDQLDADDVPLRSSKGMLMARDIVQFVPFAQVVSDAQKHNRPVDVDIAKSTLEELPGQVEDFMAKNKIKPKAKVLDRESSMVGLYDGPSDLIANEGGSHIPKQQSYSMGGGQPMGGNNHMRMGSNNYNSQMMGGGGGQYRQHSQQPSYGGYPQQQQPMQQMQQQNSYYGNLPMPQQSQQQPQQPQQQQQPQHFQQYSNPPAMNPYYGNQNQPQY